MNRRYLFLAFLLFFSFNSAFAQLNVQERKQLERQQSSLKTISYDMINGYSYEDKLEAANAFIPKFVQALKTKNSFSFPFDSLNEISILYDPEKTFRIFTWGIPINEYHYRFYGAIQQKTTDGSLKLTPLFDNAYFTTDKDTISNAKGWQGALYYNMVEKKFKNQTYYTLFGWVGKDMNISKKVLDVLTFKEGSPVFGAPLFDFTHDSTDRGIKNRFYLIYKQNGDAGLNYDKNLNLIIYDHLTSINNHPKDSSTLVPDGTYSGFKWEDGHWKYVDKIFNEEQPEEAPIPEPLKFNKKIEGNKSKINKK